MKRGDLAIQYVFYIFIGIVVVLVVIGLVTNWSFSAANFIDRLTNRDGGNGGGHILNQKVEVRDCNAWTSEIVKHAKLCQQQGPLVEDDEPLCYTLIAQSCSPPGGLDTALDDAGVTYVPISSSLGNIVVISYSHVDRKIHIE